MRLNIVLLASLLAFVPMTATSDHAAFAIANGFGFDWLDPEHAACARISANDVKRFVSCSFHDSGAFGLPLAYHSCSVNSESEYLVFETASACSEALQTMHANAP